MRAFPMATYSNWTVCYTRKYTWSSACPWTIKQLKEMCKQLAEELPGCRFAPEPICGGGVQFIEWPDMKRGEYKSIRIHADSYPWISEKTSDSAEFNVYNDTFVSLTLKAFHGAPAFNLAELKAFQKVMLQVVGLPASWHMTVVNDRVVKQIQRDTNF